MREAAAGVDNHIAEEVDNVDNVRDFRHSIHDLRPDLSTQKPGFYAPVFVDNVDKSQAEQMIADFTDISGTHGYQQIVVHTFF